MTQTVTADSERIDPETPITIGENVDTGEPVTLPVEEVLTGRAFVTGKSGSGKSNSANVVAEELLKRGLALLIIDTEGEFYSLKEEFEVLHVGADPECDLQVAAEHGEKLAELALEQNVPIVLDVSDYFDDDEKDSLIYETVRHLFFKEKSRKKPFLIIAEEAHEYVPQQGGRDELSKMMIRVGKRGRKRGLGLLAASQRPQDVDKKYISQCDWILWHRLTWDSDTKVVRRVANKKTANAVEDLGDGEGFLQADFLEKNLIRTQVRRMQTFDAGATPGLEGFDEPELRSVSEDLVDELEVISERQEQREDEIDRLETQLAEKAERIEELEERVERLKDLREMVDSTDGLPDAPDSQPQRGEASSVTLEIDGEPYQNPEVIEAEVMEIREEKADLRDELDAVREERDSLQERVNEQEAEIQELRDRVESLEWIDSHLDEVQEATRRLAEIVGVEGEATVEDEARSQLQTKEQRIQELEDERSQLADRVEELESELQDAKSDTDGESEPDSGPEPIIHAEDPELDALLAHSTIREEFEVAVTEGDYAPDQYESHLSAVVQAREGLTPQVAASLLQISDTTSRDVLRDLRDNGFLRASGERPETFHLDRDRLERRVNVAERTSSTSQR